MSAKLTRRAFLQRAGFLSGAAALSLAAPWELQRIRAQGTTTIRYLFPAGGGPEEEKVYDTLLQEFEAGNSGIKVDKVHPTGDQDILKLLQIELAAGKAADVTWLDIGSVAAFASKGGLIALDDLVAKEKYDMEDFFPPQFVGGGKYQGKLYGLPRELNCLVIFFNKNMFDEAGLDDPYTLSQKGQWNWDKFAEVGQALTKVDKRQYGFGGFDNHPWMMDMLVRMNGAQMISDDLKKVMIDDPKAIEAYQFAIDLIWKYKMVPKAGTLEGWAGTQFASKNLAMMTAGRWVVPLYSTIKDFKWGTAPMPAGKAGSFTPLVGAFHSITKDSKNQDAAWSLVKYMSDQKAQSRATELGLLIPVRKSVAFSNTFVKYPGMEPKYNQVFLDVLDKGGRLLPINENWNKYSDVWVAEAEQAFLNNEPIADAVARMKPQIEKLFV